MEDVINTATKIDEYQKKQRCKEIETKLKYERDNAVDLVAVDAAEEKANRSGHTIVKIKNTNKTAFVQILKYNLMALLEANYISNAQKSFLMSLSTCVDLHSNFLMLHEKTDDYSSYRVSTKFLKVNDIAEVTGTKVRQASKTLNELIDKGIIYEIINPQELKQFGRVVTARLLIMNPEIIIATDKNKINATLSTLVMSNDIIEKNGIKLPYKIYRKTGEENGKLYTRHAYLEFKRNEKKAKDSKESKTKKID